MTTRFVVCPTCQGRGTHVNPAIDGHGITQDEMDEQGPDFFDDYMAGAYDGRCTEGGGRNVVPGCQRCRRPAENEDGTACYTHASTDDRDEIDFRANYA